MTISADTRRDAMIRALAYMLERIGDESVSRFAIPISEGPLADLPDTTWTELAEAGLVQRHMVHNPPVRYEFTHEGWVEAHKLTGALDSDEVQSRCQRLAAALKAYVKGRGQHGDVFVHYQSLASQADVPVWWMINAVRSGLLQEAFPGKKMNARWADGNVRIPPSFGMPHLT
jgi:hypothetical protein